MDIEKIKTVLAGISLGNTDKTLGSEKAVRRVEEQSGILHIVLQFPYPIVHLEEDLRSSVSSAVAGLCGKMSVQTKIGTQIVRHKVQPGVQTVKGVKNIIAVASGKGGVGKSTVSANLAAALSRMGARVGVLDADIYGPSQPTMLGVAGAEPEKKDSMLIPVENAEGIQVMSIGFLVDTDQAVVWRGPMVSRALQQLLFQTEWNDVDYLVVDLPPGTGDIQLTLAQKIPVTGAVVVTTPQDIALLDARKAADMFEKVNIPVFGVLENMSVYVCSCCGHREAVFGSDGGLHLADTLGVPLLGRLPLLKAVREAMDDGSVALLQKQHPEVADIYLQAAWQLVTQLADKGRDYSSAFPKIVVE